MKRFREVVKDVNEGMVAGDSGGNAENIVSGKTSGAMTTSGPKPLKKKGKKK